MKTNKNNFRSYLFKIGILIFLVGFMVFHPKEIFEASKIGLDAWLKIVCPALLPFFIGSELLMSFGLVRFMGVLLEPIMRPVFNLPGAGSFIMAVGFSSGFPISSVLTAKLRQEGLCTKHEAEHLIAFTNNASPLFMLGAVAVGMFGNAKIGYLIAGAHYLANLTIGILLRNYGPKEKRNNLFDDKTHLLKKALLTLKDAKNAEDRAFGKILGDAIRNSVNTLLLIGGFVIVFSVLIKIVDIVGITSYLTKLFSFFLANFGFPLEINRALASGIWEITLGTKITSQAAAPLLFQIIAVSFILGWSGVCVHAQVASVISETDISMTPFVLARFTQGVLAAIYSYILIGPAHKVLRILSIPVFKQWVPYSWPTWWQITGHASLFFIKMSLFLLTLGLFTAFIKETKFYIFRHY